MIYIGIDISKYKHDYCIIKDTDEFIVENFTFLNNQTGFQSFLIITYQLILKRYNNASKISNARDYDGYQKNQEEDFHMHHL
ncbi:MAG: hypothetical protein ACK5HL_04525 [Bacilli bacterium]